MDEQRIVITGGAGFIGSHTVKRLVQSDPSVKIWVLDNLHPQVHGSDPKPPTFLDPDLPSRVTFVRGDVCDRTLISDLLAEARPQILLHMAAETGTGQSMDEIDRYCQANVSGTARLLEAIAHTDLPLKRLVLPSSRAIYGEGAYWDARHRQTVVPPPRQLAEMRAGRFEPEVPGAELRPIPTPEATPPAPSSVYASTKLMQEYLVQQAGAIAPWKATLLRLQNVYGPGQSLNNPYTGVLAIFSNQILAGNTLNIYEDGKIVRDFVYVDDVVSAVVRACGQDLPHGTVLNIGSGCGATIEEVAQILLTRYGRPADAYRISGDFRPGDIRHAVADIQAAQQRLDWQPQVSLESGLSQLAAWCEKRSAVSRLASPGYTKPSAAPSSSANPYPSQEHNNA